MNGRGRAWWEVPLGVVLFLTGAATLHATFRFAWTEGGGMLFAIAIALTILIGGAVLVIRHRRDTGR